METYGDEFLVLGIFAILGEDAANGLLAIQSLADFVETLHKSYILQKVNHSAKSESS